VILAVGYFAWVARTQGEAIRQSEARLIELEKEQDRLQAELDQGRSRLQPAVEEERRRSQTELGSLTKERDKVRNPEPACIDSDAHRGAEDIFYRGTVKVGNGTVGDHCRLGQLVEFECIENPPNSGRLISRARFVDCE
jgi:hypothetical protein